LVTLDELEEIRRIWVIDKHEIEDVLPGIYEEATGERYPGRRLDDNLVLGKQELDELRNICGKDRLQYELVRELLSIERQQRTQARRAGLYERMERAFHKHFYDNEADAVAYARARAAGRKPTSPIEAGPANPEGEAAP
jgi:DNA sulfur modification protein DndC